MSRRVTHRIFNSRILDIIPNAFVGYSLAQLRASATLCVRVRRSGDNSETNIGFANGMVNTAAIASFCGTGTGFVVTWYDQMGTSFHLSQNTPSSQPIIYNNGMITSGGLPAIDFSGSRFFNQVVTTGTIGYNNIVCDGTVVNNGTVRNLGSLTGANSVFGFGNVTSSYTDESFFYINNPINNSTYSNGTMIANQRISVSFCARANRNIVRFNGVSQNIIQPTAGSITEAVSITLGRREGFSAFANNRMQQLICFSTNLLTNTSVENYFENLNRVLWNI